MEERVKTIHERRRRQTCPSEDNIRYVLLIVDTSGSIGRLHFTRVKYLLALMSEKLCDHLRVAMVTFGSNINLEFCFNCHTDRCGIFEVITRARYRCFAAKGERVSVPATLSALYHSTETMVSNCILSYIK